MEELHKCQGCERQIPAHIRYCLFCKSRLNKLDLCAWCADKPRAPRTGSKQSKYCEECRAKAAEVRLRKQSQPSYQPKHRGRDARENTWETKHG